MMPYQTHFRRRIWLSAGSVALLVALGLGVGCSWMGSSQARGVTDGMLAACPGPPNCVSSAVPGVSHHVEPIAMEDDPDTAMTRLVRAVETMPRSRVERQEGYYLHATFRTALWRFVDDLECLVVPGESVIHVRSTSRVGYSDLGVNRRRIEQLRRAYSGLAGPAPGQPGP